MDAGQFAQMRWGLQTKAAFLWKDGVHKWNLHLRGVCMDPKRIYFILFYFEIFWLVFEGCNFAWILDFYFFCWMDIHVRIALQKNIAKWFYHFSWMDRMADGGPAFVWTLGDFFSSFEPPLLEEKWTSFELFFIWADIEGEILLEKEIPRNLLSFFFNTWKCRQRVGPMCWWSCGQVQSFDLVFNLHF